MTRVANVMALAFSSSNTDVEQLGYAMKYAAPQAKALGFSIEQTAAIVSKLSDAGIQGQMAGTTLRGMIDSLTDKGNAKKLKALRVDVVDKKGNLRDLGTSRFIVCFFIYHIVIYFFQFGKPAHASSSALILGFFTL